MNTNPMNNLPTMRQQRGVALIAVMMVLILIIVIGVMAVRKASTDLKTATADQMSTVLLQSAENANQKLETVVNGPIDNTYHNIVEANAGAFGYFIADSRNNHNRGDEFVFCQNNNTNYLRSRATIFRGGGKLDGDRGFCQVGNNAYTYTTDRQTVATQVSIILPSPEDGQDEDARGFAHRVTLAGENLAEFYEFDVYATSVIPSYGNPDGCFANSSMPDTNNPSPLMNCLTRSNSPYKVVYQRALVAQDTNLVDR